MNNETWGNDDSYGFYFYYCYDDSNQQYDSTITGNRVLSGVISALRVLNPLFISGAVYVDQLAAGRGHASSRR